MRLNSPMQLARSIERGVWSCLRLMLTSRLFLLLMLRSSSFGFALLRSESDARTPSPPMTRLLLVALVALTLASIHVSGAASISSHLAALATPAVGVTVLAAAPVQATTAPVATLPPPVDASLSACAPTFTSCGAHPLLSAQSASAPVCCPAATMCQRTAHSFRCVAPAEKHACDACCATGRCTHALRASEGASAGVGVMVPTLTTLQCCGSSAGDSFCCPLRTTPTEENQRGKAQKCSAATVEGAWECQDQSSMMTMSVSLYAWQIALFVVGGVLFCGCVGGGGHRAHGGHCSNDCQALTACLAGCAIFECCCAGKGGGAGAPLLG